MLRMLRSHRVFGQGALRSRRAIFSPTSPLLMATKTIKVPTMGDSITEGTIVEWVVGVGQAVKADDVVALIETDKVTVDIKAEMDGVVTQHFGAIDETVEVGAKLYEIDTEASATVSSGDNAPSPSTLEPEAAVANDAEAPTLSVPPVSGRKPSIHFLGKEGWAQQLSPTPAAPNKPVKPHAVTTLDGSLLPPMYGRPLFTEKEMDALILGGANIAPKVKSFSTGSTFGL